MAAAGAAAIAASAPTTAIRVKALRVFIAIADLNIMVCVTGTEKQRTLARLMQS
jgi:hypothetical protein